MKLSDIIATQDLSRPHRVAVYGDGGMGKTTFAAGAPSTIFIQTENIGPINVPKFPIAESWQDVLDAVKSLLNEDHNYKTVAIDSLDWMEPHIGKHVCDRAGVKHLKDGDYGSLYKECEAELQMFLVYLEKLQRNKGMNIVLISHMVVVNVQNTEGSDYSRKDMKLGDKLGARIKEWCDDVLLAELEIAVSKASKTEDKFKATTTGVRVLRTNKSPAYYAKNRHSLPHSIPLRWDAYATAVRLAHPVDPETARAEIEKLTPSLGSEDQERLRMAMTKISTPQEWTELLHRVKEKAQ